MPHWTPSGAMLWGTFFRERRRHEHVEDWPSVAGLAVAGIVLAAGGTAFAELGQPAPWEWTLQESATPVMDYITSFHNCLLGIITIITLFVLALLVIVVVKFNAKANPVPSRTTHNTLIEVAWTLIPVLILVGIAVPSFRLLFLQLDIPKADLTVKATGKQWYWSYSYPDNGKFEFDSLLVQDKTAAPARRRQRDGGAGQQGGPRPDHRRRRDPRLRGAGLRHQDRRDPRPPQRDLVQGHQERHLSTASARSCAARTTPSCRSRSAW